MTDRAGNESVYFPVANEVYKKTQRQTERF